MEPEVNFIPIYCQVMNTLLYAYEAAAPAAVGRPDESLRIVNRQKDYSTISSVLVLLDYNDLLIYYNEQNFIKQFYCSLFVLSNKNIHLLERNRGKCLKVWNPKEAICDLESLLIDKALPEVDLQAYDLVICGYSYEEELLAFIGDNYSRPLAEGNFNTAVYSFKEGPGVSRLEDINTLFFSGKRYLIPAAVKLSLKKVLEDIADAYVSLQREVQEKLHPQIVEGIIRLNAELLSKDHKNVLFLDDQRHKTYIGDICIWMNLMESQFLQWFEGASITVNWQSKANYEIASHVTQQALSKNVSFTNRHWDDIDFNQYDLVLCNGNVAGNLIFYIANNRLNKTSVYYYGSAYYGDEQQAASSGWDFKCYQKSKTTNKNLVEENLTFVRQVRYYRGVDLVISDEERDWADQWLRDRGVREHEKVTVLPDAASWPDKYLRLEEYVKLVRAFTDHPDRKVLLFDEKRAGKQLRLRQALGDERMQQVIVAEGTSLRETMRLLSSRFVQAVIGPCTGVLHLAGGIYSYFQNQKRMPDHEQPVLLTYVGLQADLHWSPWFWWGKTIVHCILFAKDTNGNQRLKRLRECSKSLNVLRQESVRVADASAELLIDYIRDNYGHKHLL